MDTLRRFAKDESAVTAIEYGLIGAAIGLMLIAVMPAVKAPLSDIFKALATGVGEVSTP